MAVKKYLKNIFNRPQNCILQFFSLNNNNISLLLYNMNRNIKYKTVCRLVLNGGDDLNKNLNSSQYSYSNNNITNSKRMRFTLNNSLNDVKLSQNAKCVLEACHIPNITNLTNNLVYLRLVASSQDKTFDTAKYLNGNPVILSTIVHSSSVSPNVIYNATDFFYSFNVASIFLEKGYLELELECITTTQNIDFITNQPLQFFILV